MAQNLILDSQALEHLEVVEVACKTKNMKEGSLLYYLDNAKSEYGKRMLKSWVCSPLTNIDKINERLDAVEDLMKVSDKVEVFQAKLAKVLYCHYC